MAGESAPLTDPVAEQPLTLDLLGDIGLNGLFCDPLQHAGLRGNLAAVAEGLGPCDLRVANLESPLWGDGGVNELKNPRLATTESTAACLLPLRVDVALLGNNHVYDCLAAGFDNTRAFLDRHGIAHLGAGRSRAEACQPLVLERRGRRIGLLSYVGPETHPNIPAGAEVHVNLLDPERALGEVAELSRDVDLVIVNLHWGEQEFVRFPSAEQRSFARRLVGVGAHVVSGHHGHRVMGHERFGDGWIFYGLGNFLFGDFGGRPGRFWPAASCRTAVARLNIDPQMRMETRMIFLRQRELQIGFDETRRRRDEQDRLDRALELSDDALDRAYRRDVKYQLVVVAPLRFVRESGGLRALGRLRRRHIENLLKAATGGAS